jgi:CheY-like chemotaxis protein
MTKLLLVEDNEQNWDMLSRRLQRRGYEVVIATDGGQGVERAQSEQPDLILMDIGLPVLDGWEATRRLRELPQTATTPTAKKRSRPGVVITTPSRSIWINFCSRSRNFCQNPRVQTRLSKRSPE